MGLTPEKVVIAAAEIADADGLDEASLSNVAAVLGVRVPSLYKHVDGLDDLQIRIALHGADSLLASLSHAVAGKSGRDALLAAFTAHRRFATSHPGQFQALVRAPLSSEQRGEFGRGIDEILRKIMDDYGVRGAEATHAVRSARSALTGFASLESLQAFDADDDTEASFYAMIALFDRGLAGPGAAAPRRGGFRLPGLPALPIPGR
ncbi:transcriptional regulator, TetR family [Frankineae bacterium MT45]|nr:transcriptional regulator, TetR family [Frankineae bacterium MT45]